MQDITFDNGIPVMTIGIMVENTSSQKFVMNSIRGDLTGNGFFIGSLSSFTPQYILPNKATLLLLDIRMAVIGIVNDIIQAWNDSNTTQNLLLKGYANVDNYNIPLSIAYKVGL